MKKQIRNAGFTKTEIIVMLCAILVLLAIGVKALSDNQNTSNYSMLRRQAENFAYKVSVYKDMYPREDNTYYLDYLIDDKYAISLSNPFDKNDECDRYESFVKIENGKKNITLKCGNYLAVGVLDGHYYIYELSEWQEEAVSGEVSILYNYKKNGKVVIDRYMVDNEFVDFYNKQENANIYSIADIDDSDIELLTKTLYRERKLVKEFD